MASLLIHKAGPLSERTESEKAALAAVYKRGLEEVAALLKNVKTTPN